MPILETLTIGQTVYSVIHDAVCSTPAATGAKTATVQTQYALTAGARVRVAFTYGNTADAPTLNVGGTGARPIYTAGTTPAGTGAWSAGSVVDFSYNGSGYVIVGGGVADGGKQNVIISGGAAPGDLVGVQSVDAGGAPTAYQPVTPTAAPAQGSNTPFTAGGAYALEQEIDAIDAKIPAQASSTNQLADKDFVNSSINSSAAYFRGSFPTRAALFAVAWQTTNPAGANYVTNNDYAYVEDDETQNDEAWRYIYVLQSGGANNGWQPQFRVNEAPLTAAQVAALNSGVTSALVEQIGDNETAISEHVADFENPHQVTKSQVGLGNVDNTSDLDKPISRAVQEALNERQVALVFDAAPAAGSTNPVYSGGIYSALEGKQDNVRQAVVSLSASWNGSGPYTQVVTVAGVTANSKIDADFSAAVFEQMQADKVAAIWFTNDGGTVTANALGAAPTAALSVPVTITEIAPAGG